MVATCQRLGSPRPLWPLWLPRLMARVEMKRLHGAWTAAAPRRFAAQTLAWGVLRLGYARAVPRAYCRALYFLGDPHSACFDALNRRIISFLAPLSALSVLSWNAQIPDYGRGLSTVPQRRRRGRGATPFPAGLVLLASFACLRTLDSVNLSCGTMSKS